MNFTLIGNLSSRTRLIFALAAILPFGAIAAEDSNQGAASKARSPGAATVEMMQMAGGLATYGDTQGDPLSLILAARILMEQGSLKPLAENGRQEGESEQPGDSAAKSPGVELSPNALLARARELAAGNDVVLRLASEVEGLQLKGAVGGNGTAGSGRVYPGYSDTYQITFEKWVGAAVYVRGDGDTDLDLHVHDENGNLICSDTDYSDEMFCAWTPDWTGPFSIKVENLGNVYNDYSIVTN